MRTTVSVGEHVINDVRRRLGKFPQKAPNAIANALNRAASNVNSNISKEVRKEYSIKAGDVKATLKKTRASRSNLRADVVSTGKLIGLEKFKVSPKTVQPNRKSPIRIGVKKTGLKKVLGAFVADINGTKVFERYGEKRLPIRRLFGPSVPQMINEDIRSQVEQEGFETFNKRLDHEIERILQRGSG